MELPNGFSHRLFREFEEKEGGGHLTFDLAPGRYKSLPEVSMCDQGLGRGVFTVRGVMLFLASHQHSATLWRIQNPKMHKNS